MLGIGEAPLVVKGHDDLLVFRAKCCNPIPGDEIVGYITRGRGVAVHTASAQTSRIFSIRRSVRIAVEWGGASAATFPVQLAIRAKDRAGLLAEITAVISGAGSNIRNLESRPDRLNAVLKPALKLLIAASSRAFSRTSAKSPAYTASSGSISPPANEVHLNLSFRAVSATAHLALSHAVTNKIESMRRPSYFPALLLLPALLAGCKSHPLTDYRPLDKAGMWSSSLQDLKKLNVSDTEIAQLVALKNAGVNDDMCVSLVQAAHDHQHPSSALLPPPASIVPALATNRFWPSRAMTNSMR
jgi:hypothetical protein